MDSGVLKPKDNGDVSVTGAQQEFIAVIVHQLRTPLSVIKLVTEELLLGKNGMDDAVQRKLRAIGEADERALNLVNNFLSIAPMLRDSGALSVTECDLRGTLESVIDVLRPIATVKGQHIMFNAPHDIEPVRVCNEYLNRAFQNILDNAVTYGSEDSEITVTLSANEGGYLVGVHNEGPAIPASELPNMFKKFHRLPEAEKSKPSGTGLGLFIAKTAVELNGGKIWMESAEGKGTTVFFTMPFRMGNM